MSSAFERLQKLAEEKKKAEKPKLEVVPKPENTHDTPEAVDNSASASGAETQKQPVAPERDFQKVSNSIVREAIPEGIFKSGKCKQLYDALYGLTRGAVQPQRTIRINKPRLMKMAGIGTRETLWQNLRHLELVGLIEVRILEGEHGGNEYTVYLPEELKITGTTPSSPSTRSNQDYSYQFLPVVLGVETTRSSPGSNPVNIDVSATPKTLLKTLRYIDDEAPILSVLEKLNETARKLTGKDLVKKDLEKFSELVDILISETMIAAARTDSVSSTVAFMTENLRRRLYSKPRSAEKKETRPRLSETGKENQQAREEGTFWTPQSLTAEQRENTLSALKEAKKIDSILYQEFKTYGEIEYTPEDFKWLLENLEKENG